MKKVLRAAAIALVMLAGGTAKAETPPSVWDRAKKPELMDEYQLHLAAQRILQTDGNLLNRRDLPNLLMLAEAQRLRLLAMLQAAGAATSKNPLLRFDLAEAYMELKQFKAAAATYQAAMRDFPTDPRAKRSRFQLAIACGHIGDHECEGRMYREVIADATAPAEIATPRLNLAETEMHNHDLREAIEEYREAYRLCGSYPAGHRTPALILWGLALALDRAGELREADQQAHDALSMAMNTIGVLRSDDVFFFPDYEVNWYEGLTFAAEARRAQTPKLRLELWQLAERRMATWVAGGEKTKNYWLPIAKARLATYTKERERAEKELGKVAPSRDDDVDEAAPWPRYPAPIPPRIKPPPPTPKTPKPPKSGDVHI